MAADFSDRVPHPRDRLRAARRPPRNARGALLQLAHQPAAAGTEPQPAWDNLAGIGVDGRWDLLEALTLFDGAGFVQGNFDQSLLFLPPDEFAKELQAYLAPLKELSAEERRGWVCGLGHGVLPTTSLSAVQELAAHVHQATRL